MVNPIKCYLLGRRDDGSSRWFVRHDGNEFRVAIYPAPTSDSSEVNSCSYEIYNAIGKDCLQIEAVIENYTLSMKSAI